VVPLRGMPRAVYSREKREAARSTGASAAAPVGGTSPSGSGPKAAVFGSLNQSGLSAEAEMKDLGPEGDVTPPDTTGAIGPSQYVEFVNDEVAAYDRSSLAIVGSPVALAEFTGGEEVCDPQIKYDPQSRRWFYVAIRCDLVEETLYMGFSKTSDPTNLSTEAGGGWCGYEYSTGEDLEDYPKLGLDANRIIIGTNSFSGETEEFLTSHIFSAAKPGSGEISSCPTAPGLTTFGSEKTPLTTSVGHVAFTPEPATVADSSSDGFVVAADWATFGKGKNIMVWRVGGTATAPTLTPLGAPVVPGFTLPPNVPQPGSTDTIDSSDTRLTQAVVAVDPTASSEAIWTQHTVNSGSSGAVVRWYELLPGTPPTLRQSGTITDSTGFAFNGAIAPTEGGAVVNYNTGNSSNDVKIMAQSRIGSDSLGVMGTPIELGSSSAIDSDFSCPSQPFGKAIGAESCRWGDYAGASVDPSNGNLVWGSSQLNGPTGALIGGFGHQAQWKTQNFALTIAKPTDAPPTGSFTPTPATALTGTPIHFAATAADSDGSISDYYFDFGDQTTAHVQNPTHTYAARGTYIVRLLVTDNAGLVNTTPIEHTITIKGAQTISFTSTAPNSPTVGGAPYTVAANASSGLAVTFSSATPSVCSVSGSTVSFIGVGTCTVDADQAGNGEYEPAPQRQQSFAVASAPVVTSAPLSTLPSELTSVVGQSLGATTMPDSRFSIVGTRVNARTGAITFRASVANPGMFNWVATFQNGKFGAFSSASKCKPGLIRLGGKCRPAKIVFAKGSKVVGAAGSVSVTLKPSASGRKALKNARKHKKGVPVTIVFSFKSSLGGSAVSHTQAVMVKLKK
jgi:PKD domain